MLTSRQRIGLLCAGLLVGGGVCLWWRGGASRRHVVDAEFAPQVYLWQRAWTEPVRAAVRAEAPAFSRVVVLARQIDFANNESHVVRIPVEWGALKETGTSIAAAVRIGPYGGEYGRDSAGWVTRCVESVEDEAKAADVALAEIQVDFDASTSKLAGYRSWLVAARKGVAPVPVTFTALPTWLDSPEFGPLAKDAGYFVLQVHWLERPRRWENPLVLCDIPTARRAIEKAGRLGVRFRVALPTYSYVAAYNEDGSFAAMAAETAPPNWGEGKRLRVVAANPDELSGLVNAYGVDRPMSMLGFIWYRLPIDSDRLNWSYSTLQWVASGRDPPPGQLGVSVKKTADRLYEVQLENTGVRDVDAGRRIRVSWSDGSLVAADGLGNFTLGGRDASSLEVLAEGTQSKWQWQLRPGERRTVAWLRFDKEPQVHADVESSDSSQPGGGGVFSDARAR